MNFKAFYGLSCNPFDKHSLKISDSFESAVSCIIKVPKVADKNGESCISILEKNATGFLISSGAYIPS